MTLTPLCHGLYLAINQVAEITWVLWSCLVNLPWPVRLPIGYLLLQSASNAFQPLDFGSFTPSLSCLDSIIKHLSPAGAATYAVQESNNWTSLPDQYSSGLWNRCNHVLLNSSYALFPYPLRLGHLLLVSHRSVPGFRGFIHPLLTIYDISHPTSYYPHRKDFLPPVNLFHVALQDKRKGWDLLLLWKKKLHFQLLPIVYLQLTIAPTTLILKFLPTSDEINPLV